MHRIVNDEALDILFRAARTRPVWLERPVGDTLLRALWELVKLGPTNAPAGAAHIVFVRSADARQRLGLAVSPAERQAVAAAPVTAILAGPANDAAAAARAGALRAAYLILAGRALGLDCSPVWSFDGGAVDRAFFPDGRLAASCLCGLGYSDAGQPPISRPLPAFDEACTIR